MTNRQRETSREVRLWVKDIIVPAIIAGAVIFKNEGARTWIKEKCESLKNKFKKD